MFEENYTFKPLGKKEKKKNLFYGCDGPKFSIWQIIFFFFFFLIFQNFVKLAIFWPKSKNFGSKFLKISQNIFPKLNLQKWPSPPPPEIFMFLGSFLLPGKKKHPTDLPYLADPQIYP